MWGSQLDAAMNLTSIVAVFMFGIITFYQNMLMRQVAEKSLTFTEKSSQQSESLNRELIGAINKISTGMESISGQLEKLSSENSESDISSKNGAAYDTEKLALAIQDLAKAIQQMNNSQNITNSDHEK